MAVEINEGNFEQEIKQHQGLALVDFWAEWCTPCKILQPIIEELAKEMNGKVKIGSVDVDTNPNLTSSFGIRGIPSVILFKNGEPVDMIVGVREKEVYVNLINQHGV